MKLPKLYINYIFDINEIENPNQVEISNYIKLSNKFTLNFDEIIIILENDSESFDGQNIRYFDTEKKVFILINPQFEVKIDQSNPNLELLLLLKRDNPKIKKEIQKLSKEIMEIKEELNKKSVEIEDIRSSQLYMLEPEMLTAQPSVNSINNSTSCVMNNNLDISILYADPLIFKNDIGEIQILGDPIDFQSEVNSLKIMLNEINKKITIRIEIATIKNLTNVISLKPTILHIFCNGFL